jgi:hypothetical protein
MPVAWKTNVLGAVAKGRSGAGASFARRRLRLQALDFLRAEGLGEVLLSYSVVPLDATASGILRAGGEWFDAPLMLPAAGELTALAFGVCTLSPAVEERIRGLFREKRASLALAVDGVANELLFEGSNRMRERLLSDVSKRGLCVSGELRPGDPGLAQETQRAVMRLAHGDELGVRVNSNFVLSPMKSVTVMYGVGQDLPPALWSRCEECRSREKCAVAQRDLGTLA